jgi:glycosyltransferase involved in cell wall biosynthesis
MLTEINHRDDRVRIVSLARAYGQAASLEAGFEHARGDMIVTFDGDLELHPEHIQKLLDKMAEGYDVVCGVPTATPARRKAKTFFANLVISTIAGVTVRERACALALYNRAAVKRVGLSGEIFLWLPLIAHGLGLATAEVPIEVHRCAGDESASERSYAIPPVLEVIAAQFLTNASPGPMRYFGKLSLWTVAVGVLISTLVLVWAIRANGDPAWIALPIALFALLAMLLIAIGFITEMVTRAHQQAHYRTSYVVKEVIE